MERMVGLGSREGGEVSSSRAMIGESGEWGLDLSGDLMQHAGRTGTDRGLIGGGEGG